MAYDILQLREIFIVNSVEIPGFTCFCTKAIKSAKGRPQGGLAAALSKQLIVKCNFIHENNNLLELQIKEISLIIIVAYIPPNNDLETKNQALTETFQCCQGKARMILGGDYNCRLESTDGKRQLFSVCAPPSTLCSPQLQSTCHYIVNHYVNILHVHLGVANNMHPLSWGGGGTNGKDP